MLTFYIGTCKVNIMFSGFALLAFSCLFAGIGGGASLLFAVLLHETAHLAAMLLMRATPELVQLSALGCRIVLGPQICLDYRQNMIISMAGPCANIISLGIMLLLGKGNDTFAQASMALGMFHCLPIEPLDGGLAFRAFLCRFMSVERASAYSRRLSLVFLFPMAVMGFLVLLHSRYNFSLLAISVYLMLYLVLKEDYL